jgi:hypothetical protein
MSERLHVPLFHATVSVTFRVTVERRGAMFPFSETNVNGKHLKTKRKA